MDDVDDVLIGTDAVKAGQLKTGHTFVRYLQPQQRQLAPITEREAGDLQVMVRKSLVDRHSVVLAGEILLLVIVTSAPD